MPVTGDADGTCCVSLTCGELKEKESDPDLIVVRMVYSIQGISDKYPTDTSEKPCCSAHVLKHIKDPDKCTDPTTYHGPPADGKQSVDITMYAYTKLGNTKNVKVENMKYNITKNNCGWQGLLYP